MTNNGIHTTEVYYTSECLALLDAQRAAAEYISGPYYDGYRAFVDCAYMALNTEPSSPGYGLPASEQLRNLEGTAMAIWNLPHRKIIRSSGNPEEFIKGALFAFSVSSKQLPKPTINSKPGTLAYYPHEIVAKLASLRNVANFLPQNDCYTDGYIGAIDHVIQISKGWPQSNTRGNGIPSSNILNAIEGAELLFTSEHSRRGLPIRKGARTALFAIRTHFELHNDESRAIRKRLYYELEKIRPGISQGRTEIEQDHTPTPTTEEEWRRMFAQFELPTEYPFGGFDDLFDMPRRATQRR